MTSACALACVALACVALACGAPPSERESPAPPSPPPSTYLHDASFRRATLEASLVNPQNGYSQLRLERYGRAWDVLPEYNPRAQVVAASELDAPGGVVEGAPLGESATSLLISDAARAGDPEALRALGEQAFFRYPVQLAGDDASALHSRAGAASYGYWVDDARGAGGLVRVAFEGGTRGLARTCSTCHAGMRGGALAIGAPNASLDLGKLAVDANPFGDPTIAAKLLRWGPGRLDVTTADASEPVAIADLRPVRGLTYLQRDATVVQRDLATLAIRIETLIITSQDEVVRPPREIALGLATYVWSLEDALTVSPPLAASEQRGATLFAASCEGCHAPPAFTGPPTGLDTIGTDPMLGRSADRGTGAYRVPSLRGVATRGPLLHDGAASGLDALFDPARLDPSYAGGLHRAGAVAGHAYGLDFDASSRADLIAFLKTL